MIEADPRHRYHIFIRGRCQTCGRFDTHCGHDARKFVHAKEGTSHCPACEAEGRRRKAEAESANPLK